MAYFVLGGLSFALLPLANEFRKYPAVYRSQDAIMGVMPAGMVAMFVAIAVLAMIYPSSHTPIAIVARVTGTLLLLCYRRNLI